MEIEACVYGDLVGYASVGFAVMKVVNGTIMMMTECGAR